MVKSRSAILFLIMLMVLPTKHFYAQSADPIDSLKGVLKIARSDTNKINTLIFVGKTFKEKNDEQNAIEYLNLSIKLSDSLISISTGQQQSISIKKKKAEALAELGSILLNEGDYSNALQYYEAAFEIRKSIGDKKGYSRSAINIGIVYKSQGDYPKALDYYLLALKNSEAIKDNKGISTAYNNIGILYSKKGEKQKALDYYQKAYNINKELKDKKGMASALINMGIIYNKNNEFQKALDNYFEALKLKEEVKDKGGMASALNNIGNVYEKQKIYDKAIEYYNKSLLIKEKMHDKQGMSLSYNNIGTAYEEQGNYKKAEELFQKALSLAEEIRSLEDIREGHFNLSELYQLINKPEKAFIHFKKYIAYKDSLYNEESTKKMVRSEMNFEFEKKQQIEKLEQEKRDAVQQAKLENQRVILYAFIAVAVLLLAFSFMIFRSYRQKQKQNEIIEDKNRELEKLSIVASETASGVFITDANGEMEWFNEGFSRLFGWNSLEEYKQKRGSNIFGVSANENIKEIIQKCVADRTSITYENPTPNSKGEQLWIKTTLTPIFDRQGNLQKMIFIETDVSELKKAQQTAEQSLQIQEQFLANTSHEIRTPMNGVLGMTRQLMETPLSDEQLEYISAIKESSNSLLRVVNDILDISKIRAGKIVFEKTEFRIADLFKTLQFTLQYKAEEKNVQLRIEIDKEIPPVLLGDPVRLNQILLNLAGNAIKFTDKGFVLIKANRILEKNGLAAIKFSVTDTGVGIPSDKLEYIFEVFAQAETHTTRKYGGTGLGLSISRFLVEQQGGKIKVESEMGKGSVFSFELQFEIGDKEWKGSVSGSIDDHIGETNLQGVKVLLVEDNIINQRVAGFELKKWRVELDFAENAVIAFEKLKNKSYDLILMDISMPGMDGLEATRYIREHFEEPARSMPIIAMTASALTGEKEKCFTAGMNDYISKPFDPIVLRNKLIKWTKQGVVSEQPEIIKQAATNGKLTNFSTIMEHAAGDMVYVKEMIKIYLHSMPEYLSELNFFYEQKNWDEVRKHAHKMKTPAAYFGANELKELLYRAEIYTGQNATTELFTSTIKRVNDLCVQSCRELELELKKLS